MKVVEHYNKMGIIIVMIEICDVCASFFSSIHTSYIHTFVIKFENYALFSGVHLNFPFKKA